MILVQWNSLCTDVVFGLPICYLEKASSTQVVGLVIGKLIEELIKSRNADPKKFILIGHSLGAHIMGFAGRYINDTLNTKVGIIMGLDPARPCFVDRHPDYRLDPTDACLVEAIHTSREFGDCMSRCVFKKCQRVNFYQCVSRNLVSH